jgi:hypothetical protein
MHKKTEIEYRIEIRRDSEGRFWWKDTGSSKHGGPFLTPAECERNCALTLVGADAKVRDDEGRPAWLEELANKTLH